MRSEAELVTLDLLADYEEAAVSACHNRKAHEMGLGPGARVRMLRNRRRELAVVVASMDARFMISRDVARQILVVRSPSETVKNNPAPERR